MKFVCDGPVNEKSVLVDLIGAEPLPEQGWAGSLTHSYVTRPSLVKIPTAKPLFRMCRIQLRCRPRDTRTKRGYPDSKVHGANMGSSGADRTHVGPMLAPWTLLVGYMLDIDIFSIVQSVASATKPNSFHITGPLWEESTGHQWVPLTKGQYKAYLWCALKRHATHVTPMERRHKSTDLPPGASFY